MKFQLLLCVTALCVFLPGMMTPDAVKAAEPVNIIFDTDIGNDIDDTLALALLHNFVARGDCRLLAITLTKENEFSPIFTQFLNEFYGHQIPIGKATHGVVMGNGGHTVQTLESKNSDGSTRFPWFDFEVKREFEPAVTLLRKTLAAADDNDVVVVQVGFSSNLAALLDTPGDDISPLSGKELMAKKVKFCSVMAGSFSDQYHEYNVVNDIPSAQKFFNECPVPIYLSEFQIGSRVTLAPVNMLNDYSYCPNHPVQIAYGHQVGYDREQGTWDLTSVLYAVRPDRGYFGISPAGVVHVADDSVTTFEEKADGKVFLLTMDEFQAARVKEVFIWLCSEPPKSK
ncbi:MAG: nucleoside hydrolase [Planctomycetia bacterium]|nr:nucleoside hydrolase [Planctomycetia bacterium]